jgi:hypothetical protein
MCKYLWLTLFIFLALAAGAQVTCIDTDRPDQTESAFTVPKGWIQGELGFVKEKAKSPAYSLFSWTIPTLLTKYGLSKKWELRLITEYNRQGNKDRLFKDTFGLLPVQLGFKVNLFEGKGIIPRISLIYHTAFNRIASRLSRGGSFIAPNFRFTLQNNIADGIALGYNIGMEWDDLREKPAYIYTFAPAFDIGEKWYAYVEVFGSLRKGESPEHAFDAGVAYYVNENLKLDASAAIGLSRAAIKNYIGMGCSFRFKPSKNK